MEALVSLSYAQNRRASGLLASGYPWKRFHEWRFFTPELSGGERSFTTVAFVLSLWENMESPFICMDEFDVFMDPVNRLEAMKMITEFAKSNPQRQFIFLSPLSTNHAELAGKDALIIKLEKIDE